MGIGTSWRGASDSTEWGVNTEGMREDFLEGVMAQFSWGNEWKLNRQRELLQRSEVRRNKGHQKISERSGLSKLGESGHWLALAWPGKSWKGLWGGALCIDPTVTLSGLGSSQQSI